MAAKAAADARDLKRRPWAVPGGVTSPALLAVYEADEQAGIAKAQKTALLHANRVRNQAAKVQAGQPLLARLEAVPIPTLVPSSLSRDDAIAVLAAAGVVAGALKREELRAKVAAILQERAAARA